MWLDCWLISFANKKEIDLDMLNFNLVLLNFKATKNFMILLANFGVESGDFQFDCYYGLTNKYFKSCFAAFQRSRLAIDFVDTRFSKGRIISSIRRLHQQRPHGLQRLGDSRGHKGAAALQ